jgi:hypothetical protein
LAAGCWSPGSCAGTHLGNSSVTRLGVDSASTQPHNVAAGALKLSAQLVTSRCVCRCYPEVYVSEHHSLSRSAPAPAAPWGSSPCRPSPRRRAAATASNRAAASSRGSSILHQEAGDSCLSVLRHGTNLIKAVRPSKNVKQLLAEAQRVSRTINMCEGETCACVTWQGSMLEVFKTAAMVQHTCRRHPGPCQPPGRRRPRCMQTSDSASRRLPRRRCPRRRRAHAFGA